MLSILNVGFPLAPVGPDAVGGAEQVASMLDEALVELGHRSVVIAAQGSRARGTLYETALPLPPYDDRARRAVHREHADNIRRAVAERSIDVIHMHGVDFFEYMPPPGIPALVTLHLPPSFYPDHALPPSRPDTFVQCVSDSQASRLPRPVRESPRVLAPIANGVRVERFRFEPRKEARLAVALGRVCPEKGFHLAMDAARLSRMDLVLAGEVFPYHAHQDYFAREIVSRLDARRRFVGPLGFEEKVGLLARARCLVVSSLVDETSSLVAMEALACGTPVVAFSRGALTEIVEHGKTGFLVDDVDSMARAMEAAGDIDPRACRESAERRFSATAVCSRHVARYHWLKNRRAADG